MSVATDLNARVVAGLATIVKNGAGNFTLTDRRWNELTGVEIAPVVSQVLLSEVNTQIDLINTQIATLRDVEKADLIALRTYLLSI